MQDRLGIPWQRKRKEYDFLRDPQGFCERYKKFFEENEERPEGTLEIPRVK